MWPLLIGAGLLWLFGAIAKSYGDYKSTQRLLPPPRSESAEFTVIKSVGPTSEERKERTLTRRLRSLQSQYQEHAHYEDAAWLTSYARQHMTTLLTQRADILAESRQLHEQRLVREFDEDLSYVEEHSPSLYARMTWQVRVLAIAERLYLEEQQSAGSGLQVTKLTEHTKRIAELFLEYRDFAHYEQNEWVERYANSRVRIPRESCHQFHGKVATNST